jgi:hypothetical protein
MTKRPAAALLDSLRSTAGRLRFTPLTCLREQTLQTVSYSGSRRAIPGMRSTSRSKV